MRLLCLPLIFVSGVAAQTSSPLPPVREQAAIQQEWLKLRLDRVLPPLLRKHDVNMWLVVSREYNEDPVFHSLVSPTMFVARRRTIYVFSTAARRKASSVSPSGEAPTAVSMTSTGTPPRRPATRPASSGARANGNS